MPTISRKGIDVDSASMPRRFSSFASIRDDAFLSGRAAQAVRLIGVSMEGFKEFQGKSLDAAIIEACQYFNLSREKLEIEIVQDAKSGIFGIVGARKAKIRARRAALREAVESVLGRSTRLGMNLREEKERTAPEQSERAESHERAERTERGERHDRAEREERSERRQEKSHADRAPRAERCDKNEQRPAPGATRDRKEADKKEDDAPAREHGEKREHRPRREERRAQPPRPQRKAIEARENAPLPAPAGPRQPVPAERETAEGISPRQDTGKPERERKAPRQRRPVQDTRQDAEREMARPVMDEDMLDETDESLPCRSLEELDKTQLESLASQCVSQLVRPVVGELISPPEVAIVDGRVRVSVDCGEDSGLLIGREGQTLAALQYLSSRIVSRGMDAAVRVQLDAGRYRQRQEEKLREMALALATKVRQSGRSYSTRPLSSYHRRIVHLCLQEMEDIQTRSTGDGPMKRVVILRRRPDRQEQEQRRAPRDAREGKAQTAAPQPVAEEISALTLPDAAPVDAVEASTPDTGAMSHTVADTDAAPADTAAADAEPTAGLQDTSDTTPAPACAPEAVEEKPQDDTAHAAEAAEATPAACAQATDTAAGTPEGAAAPEDAIRDATAAEPATTPEERQAAATADEAVSACPPSAEPAPAGKTCN